MLLRCNALGLGGVRRGVDVEEGIDRRRRPIGDGDAMARGDRVELRGFGAFSVKNRPARVGRNPRTGEQVDVGEKYVPQFKAGKEIRERLNR